MRLSAGDGVEDEGGGRFETAVTRRGNRADVTARQSGSPSSG